MGQPRRGGSIPGIQRKAAGLRCLRGEWSAGASSARLPAVPPLPQGFYVRPVEAVARDLLGRTLHRGGVVLRITEVEAYGGPEDSASHCRFRQTPRNAPMWGPPGRAYVYLCYGLHRMLNVVTRPQGQGSAVLIRSAEPVRGLDTVRERRGGKEGPVLLTGPGKVGQALELETDWSGHPMYRSGGLWIGPGEPPTQMLAGPRVGIEFADAADRAAPLRFAVAGSRWVSSPKGLQPL